ncbi:MAG TPA: hypothetical protein VN868_07865, partial [Terriglobales bacterium]|nr:hypothetical protein [Terriglobales bacterium]
LRFEPGGRSLTVAKQGVPATIIRRFLDNRPAQVLDVVAPSDPAGIVELRNFRLSADGKSYIYSYYRVLSDLWIVDGLK